MLKKYSWETRTNLNISGGSERIKYFFSLGYLTQNGMYNTDIYDPGYDTQIKYRRYNMRSNFDINITKRLKASFDVSAPKMRLTGYSFPSASVTVALAASLNKE